MNTYPFTRIMPRLAHPLINNTACMLPQSFRLEEPATGRKDYNALNERFCAAEMCRTGLYLS